MRSAAVAALSARSSRAPAVEQRWLAARLRRNPARIKATVG